MAAPINVKVALGLESDAAKANLTSFSNEFKDTLKGMGAQAMDIRFFVDMAKAIDAGTVSLADFDIKTQSLLTTFRQGRDVAAARDFLGVPAHADVQAQIEKTRQAYETLKTSGVLTGAELAQAALKTKEKIGELEASTNGWRESLGKMKGELAVAAGAIYGIVNTFGAAAGKSAEFGKSMAEVSTLLDDTSGMDAMTKAVEKLSLEFGDDVSKNAKALYNIISAGASTSAQAIDTLTVANKLALGGVTDVSIAANGLTSAMNAYGDSAGSASQVSDAFFVAVKSGQTKVEELAGSIGKVAPIANAAGVGLEELLAATATLTSGGQATSEAMNAIKAALSSVIKPSSEAEKLAQSLGLQFDATALKSKGLAGFLADVQAKTGGNIETMGQLFGSVEGLNGILTLTGAGAEKFATTLEGMAGKAGATDTAVAKMMDTPAQRQKQFEQSFQAIQRSVGDAVTAFTPLLQVVTGAMNAFNDLDTGTKTVVAGIGALAVALPPIALAISSFAKAWGILRLGIIGATTAGVAHTIGTVAIAGATTAATGAITKQTIALKLLKLAMIGTGIGVLVVGAGMLAEKFIGSAEASEKLNKNLEKIETDKVAKVARDTAAAEVALAKAAEKARQFQDDLKALGIDEEEFKSGLTSAEKALTDSFARMVANANVSSDKLLVGFGNAIQEVGIKGLDAFAIAAVNAFHKGRISAEQLEAAMSVVDERRKELTTGTMDLEAAYKALGITSQAALQKVAASAKEAYETIVKQGGTLADQAAAWKVYAERAIAANGGVASSILQAEAAQHGLTIAIDESGKASIRTKEALEGIADAARRAAQKVTAANTVAMEAASIAASQARTSIGSMQGSIDGFVEHLHGMGTAVGSWLNSIRADMFAMSEAALESFNSMRAGVEGGTVGAYLEGLAKNARTVTTVFNQQAEVAEYWRQRLADGADTARDLDTATKILGSSLNLLGEQQLDPLRAAIADAERRMLDLRAAAQSTLDSIQDEWDQLNNNLDEIERRRAEKKEAEVQAQLAAARASGDREAIADLERALSLLKQVNAARIAEAKAREEEARKRTQTATTTSTSSASATRSSVTLTLPGGKTGTVNLASPADANALTGLLKQLQLDMQRAA